MDNQISTIESRLTASLYFLHLQVKTNAHVQFAKKVRLQIKKENKDMNIVKGPMSNTEIERKKIVKP